MSNDPIFTKTGLGTQVNILLTHGETIMCMVLRHDCTLSPP